MAIPAKNILGNPNVTEGSFQIAIEQLRESVIGSGKTYNSANTYMIKDICEYSGVIYYSKINNNIGNTPSIGANWGDYADLILGAVHKTGNETIAGVKTFSDNVGIGVTPNNDYSLILGGSIYQYGPQYNVHTDVDCEFVQRGAGGYKFFVNNGTKQPLTITAEGNVIVTGSGGLGYGTGSGGTVTQLTSKGTNVTLNKPSGKITMHGASLASNTSVSFKLNSSSLSSNDIMIVTIIGGVESQINYRIESVNTVPGASFIRLTNLSAGYLSEALIFQYNIIKGATA